MNTKLIQQTRSKKSSLFDSAIAAGLGLGLSLVTGIAFSSQVAQADTISIDKQGGALEGATKIQEETPMMDVSEHARPVLHGHVAFNALRRATEAPPVNRGSNGNIGNGHIHQAG